MLLCYVALVAAGFAILARKSGAGGFSAIFRIWFTPSASSR